MFAADCFCTFFYALDATPTLCCFAFWRPPACVFSFMLWMRRLRSTGLPMCERQPYSLFHNSPLSCGERACYDRSYDFSRQISPLCVLCSIMEVCSLGCCLEGDGEGGKRGTGGENPEGEGGLQPGCPPSPGLSPQDIGKLVLRICSTQSIKNESGTGKHKKRQGGRWVSTALLLPSNSRYPDPPHRSGADPPPAARPGWRWWWLR